MDVEAQYLSEPGPVGLFTRLTRVALLVDAFQHRCLDPYGLLFIDYSVLRLLQLTGRPHRMLPTELSEIVLRSSGGMTQILDRLEKLGLVARSPDPSDRRKVLVGLTRAGLRTAARVNESYLAERERLLDPLSEVELEQLDGAIHRLLEVLQEASDGGPGPAATAASPTVAATPELATATEEQRPGAEGGESGEIDQEAARTGVSS